MPIYEYRCQECGEKFEKLVRSMNSALATECPNCGGQRVNFVSINFGMQPAGSASEPICPTCMPRR
mgnify:CR=1 FL=1